MKKDSTLFIKNMVCERCIMAVRDILCRQGAKPLSVELGSATVEGMLSLQQIKAVEEDLNAIGFELSYNKEQRTIESIKTLIIQLVRHDKTPMLSAFLSQQLHTDYGALSKLFSGMTGITIEKFYILHRIERVKELITYEEMSLTEIALKMNYSSTAYLSTQFKAVTGMTPSQFKANKCSRRKYLDKVNLNF